MSRAVPSTMSKPFELTRMDRNGHKNESKCSSMCVGEKVIEKAEEIFKSIGRFFFLPFFMAPCHNATSQSRTYRFFFLRHSPRYDNHNSQTFPFFCFSWNCEAQSRRTMRPSRGHREASGREKRERVWLDETRNSPRWIGIGDGRQSRRVASRFLRGKRAGFFFFSTFLPHRFSSPFFNHLNASLETSLHSPSKIIIISVVAHHQSGLFFCAKKKLNNKKKKGQRQTSEGGGHVGSVRKDITRTSIYTGKNFQLTPLVCWPIFNSARARTWFSFFFFFFLRPVKREKKN